MESIAFEKGIVMESDISPDLTFYGIKEQIQQLAGILIDNALTYTSPQGQIQITLKKESHHLVFTVSNTGDEIPESERIRLFERFYRSDKARSRTFRSRTFYRTVHCCQPQRADPRRKHQRHEFFHRQSAPVR